MFEFFQTLGYTLRDYKRWFIGLIIVSSFCAIFSVFYNKPKYEVSFEISPYFEMAQDIENEFKRLRDAFNNGDHEYIKRILNIHEISENINSAQYWKRAKLADYSFKHVNLVLTLQLSDTNSFDLKTIDDALIKYCRAFVSDTSKSYRGVEVYKQKIKSFKTDTFTGLKDGTVQFFKNDFLRQDLMVSESTVNQLIFAQILGEYKSAFKINVHQIFSKSLKQIPPIIMSVELFLLIQFGPFFALLLFLRSYKYEQ